jgi:hypothetical protein
LEISYRSHTPANGRQKKGRDVRLFEHPDFGQAILQATEHFQDAGLRPAIIEKG